jgi:dihydrofolate synthase/folylpolyglutamate synthase
MIGVYQPRNTVISLAIVNALGERYVTPLRDVSRALAKVFLPGRFQRSGKFIFDVAHNPNAAQALAETVRAADPPRPRTALLAVLADKDWRGVIRALAPVVDRFVFTSAPSAPPERTWKPEEARGFAVEARLEASVEPDFDKALRQAEKGSKTVLVTGSFHTVGDAMSRLQVSPFAA